MCVGMLRLESALMFPSGFENQGALSPLGDRLRAKPGPPNLANHPSFSRPLSFVFLLRHSLQNNLLFMLSLSLILYFFAGTLSFSFLVTLLASSRLFPPPVLPVYSSSFSSLLNCNPHKLSLLLKTFRYEFYQHRFCLSKDASRKDISCDAM